MTALLDCLNQIARPPFSKTALLSSKTMSIIRLKMSILCDLAVLNARSLI